MATVEKKVTWATVGSYLGGVALLAIGQATQDLNLVDQVPASVEIFVGPLLTSFITFWSGWTAKHTPRVEKASLPVK